MEIVVANLYKLFHRDGVFHKDQKDLVRKGAKVTREYVESNNANWEDNGKWYEIDEEATAENQLQREMELEERNNRIELKRASDANLLGNAMSNVLESAAKKQPVKKKVNPVKEDEPKTDK